MSLLTTCTEVLFERSALDAGRNPADALRVETPIESEIGREIQRILQTARAEARPQRFGGEERYPYPYDVFLTPIARDYHLLLSDTLRVRGKHISHQGLEFVHAQLLPYRHMIASFRLSPNGWLGVLLELTWCRFVRRDTYENGGRFLRLTLSPLDAFDGAAGEHDLAPMLFSLSSSPGKDEVQ